MALTFDADESDLKLFLQEADEQIELLQNESIRLEKEYQDQALVQNIFRAAHTLKGSSGMIGHHRMTDLTHAMESVFDMIRKNMLVPTTEIVDTILASLDGLNVLREEVATKEESDVDLSGSIAALHAIVEGASTAPAAPKAAAEAPEDLSPEALKQAAAEAGSPTSLLNKRWLEDADKDYLLAKIEGEGQRAYLVQAELAPDSPWLAVRAFQILTDLGSVGDVYKSWPSKTEVEEEKVTPHMDLVVVSKEDPARLTQAVSTIEDVASATVEAYAVADLRPPAPPASAPEPPPAPSPTDLVPATSQAPAAAGKRLIDLGPDGRGKNPSQLLELAAQKMEKLAQNVRVDVERLDKLMNLVGELVVARSRLQQVGSLLEAELGAHDSVDILAEASQEMGRITDDLQEEVTRIRMQPIENVFNKFPRLIRTLSQQLGKKIDLVLEGKETELDRSVIEKIEDPLIHLLRNAADHGIESIEARRAAGKPETGLIKLSAWHEEGHIIIAVQDDGAGMDPEKLRSSAVRKGLITQEVADRMDDRTAVELIFAAGFSTAAQTTDISGRGVGMDIVRANIEKLGGSVVPESAIGRGTRFMVKLPLTLAIIRALLVNVGGQQFAIPMTTVDETNRFDPADIRTVKGREAIQLRGKILPLVSLREIFNLPPLLLPGPSLDDLDAVSMGTMGGSANGSVDADAAGIWAANGEAPPPARMMFVVVVRVSDRQMGLEVDSFVGETEIVIKPLSRALGEIRGIAGVTILGDGQVAIICDVPSLLTRMVQEQMLA